MTCLPILVGVDFAGPKDARQQRRKILAIAATRLGERQYRIAPDGFNARLLQSPACPGWTAEELAGALIRDYPAGVVALDFPFSIPEVLLASPEFAAAVGAEHPFGSWQAFNRFVEKHLPLTPPIDLTPFKPWRRKEYW